MKTQRILTYPVFLLILLIGSACSGDNSETDQHEAVIETEVYEPPAPRFCFEDISNARIIGHLYNHAGVLRQSYEPLNAFLRENQEAFSYGSPIISCMQDLGNYLQLKGHIEYAQNPYSDAYESAVLSGANPDQARSIASGITQNARDLVAVGEELTWLSKVIPEAANGNWEPFLNTGTEVRIQVRALLPFLTSYGDDFLNGILSESINMFEPMMVEYIATIATMSKIEAR